MGQWASSSASSGENKIPLDITLMIVDALDHSSLKSVSLLNRNLHRLADAKLWRQVTLSDVHPSSRGVLAAPQSARKRRRNLSAACAAVMRDAERAKHIRTIILQTSRPLAKYAFLSMKPIKRVVGALQAATQLTHLEIAISQQWHCDSPRDQEMLARLMAASADAFSFHLQKFVCAHRMDPLLEPFLRRQSRILEYYLFEDLRGEGEMHETTPTLVQRRSTILPLLNHIQGPPSCIRSWLLGRTLDTVTIKSYFTEHALSYIRSSPPTKDSSNSSLCNAHKVSLGLWVHRSNDYVLPSLIQSAYGVALEPIAVLRIESYRAPNREMIPKALARFPNLLNFRWDMHGRSLLAYAPIEVELGALEEASADAAEAQAATLGDGNGEPVLVDATTAITADLPDDASSTSSTMSTTSSSSSARCTTSWHEKFVTDCVSHASSLRKITLSEMHGMRRTYKRVSKTSWKRREARAAAKAEATLPPHFFDGTGNVWTVEVEMGRMMLAASNLSARDSLSSTSRGFVEADALTLGAAGPF